MSKCLKCAASWSSPGMTMCPICGAKVNEPATASEPSQAKLEPELAGVKATSVSRTTSVRLNKSALLQAAPDARPSASSTGPRHGSTTALPAPAAPKPMTELKITTFPKPQGRPETPPTLAQVPKKDENTENSREEAQMEALRTELPKVETPLRVSTRLVDASVALLAVERPEEKELPKAARPLNGPLILGVLSLITGILLPITIAFESNRVLGIMGFCLSGFFVPFSPIAWIAGLAAEKRRREQGLRPESRVVLGRLLGQWGTLLLVTEVTAALLLIAGLRLAGKLPHTFWNVSF